jgi:hypothetical protein
MRKTALILLAAIFLLSSITSPVFAAGGKHHGVKGEGSVHTGMKVQGKGAQERAGR